MIKKLTFVIILIFLLLISCNKKQSELEFEKSVVEEIFPALLDSVHHDRRLSPPPPPPPPPPKLDGTPNDSITYEWDEEKMMAEYEKRKAKIKKDTTKLVVVIRDSTYQISKRAKREFIEYYKKYSIELDSVNDKLRYKIDISELDYDKKFKLKYGSKFPKTSSIWDMEYDFHLSGITWMSRIHFDKTKKFGVLESGFGCGKLCGFGGIVMIRKLKDEWIIEEIIVHTVS
jgi:hypothetical protein